MRKFFGVVGLLFCVLLASCSFNNFSGKNGSLEFSISKNDIAQLASRSAFRAGEGDETEIQELLFFVQIKGSKGYYAYKSQTVGIEVPKEKKEISNKENSDYNESVDEDFDYSEESINILQSPLNDAKIVFEKIPANQTYTVMFDMLVRGVPDENQIAEEIEKETEISDGQGTEYTPPAYHKKYQELQSRLSYHICSGKTKNVTVAAGQTNQVDVTAVLEQKGLLSLKIDFEDEPSITVNNDPDEEKNWEDYQIMLTKKDNELYRVKYNWDEMGNSNPDFKKVKDISYVFTGDSNFTDSWVTYTLYGIGGKYKKDTLASSFVDLAEDLIEYQMTFTNGTCSIRDTILQYDSYSSAFLSLDSNGFSFIAQCPLFSYHYDPVEQQEVDDSTVISQDIHGSLITPAISEQGGQVTQNLPFSKRQTLKEKNRYIYPASLSEILGDKTLNEGDTVVFVMKTPGGTDNQSLGFTQFYYELQKSNWEDIDNEYLFDGNECISCDNYPAINGYYTFVMPLNFVQSPTEYDTVLFFFDKEKGTSETTETQIFLPVLSLEYHIFPASTKTFVFGLGQNWAGGGNSYRYEFKLPLVDSNKRMLNLVEDDDVNVRITGLVKYYGLDTSVNLDLTSEIYDGACCNITSEYEKKGNNEYYHPLSNTGGNALNNTVRTVVNGVITGDGYFNFGSILAPFYDYDASGDNPAQPAVSHNYQFQCYTPCDSPSVLLTIQGFNMVATHTAD